MQTSSIPAWTGKFSHREIQILYLIADGLSNREISQKLFLSLDTVKWYNKHLFAKLGVNNRTQALKLARHYRLIQYQPDDQEEEKFHFDNPLPSPLTSYVGRSREIGEIKTLLKANRLVVLTGAGGTGKTRLALQIARELADTFQDGVRLIDLAPLTDPEQVIEAVARALKVTAVDRQGLIGVVKKALSRKNVLLLLDNFEHLLDAAPLVTELLTSAPHMVILVTSRERLHVYGEVEYPVWPLSIPDTNSQEQMQELASYEAVDLFIQRARAARPDLNFDEADMVAAARICQKLDGLPLAVELAASQTKLLPLSMLAQKIENGLEALPDGPRDVPARQRTLRATIEWSYNLLNPSEKLLLGRVAIFGGSATLEAVERVCGVDLPGRLSDILSALVDKNLIFTRESKDGELRFSMLETIREYSSALLRMGGEYEIMQQRLIEYFTDLAEQYEREIHGPRHVQWNALMRAERNNLSPILDWAHPDPWSINRLRIIAGLAEHWYMNGCREDMHWLPTAIQKAADAPIGLRAKVLRTVGEIYRHLGDQSQAEDLLRNAIELFEETGDEHNAAWAMVHLSAVIDRRFPENIHCAQRSLELFRQYEDKAGISKALTSLGEIARIQGDLATAETCYKESLLYSSQTGERIRDSIQYSNLSFISFRRGAYQQALECALSGIKIMSEMDIPDVSTLLYGLAGPTAALGNPYKAACLLGAAQAQLDSAGLELQTADLEDAQLVIATTRQTLEEAAWRRAWEAGYVMTPKQALEFAMQGH